MNHEEYSFTRYLAAKRSVDDRALNRQVWQALVANLPTSRPDDPLRVLEIGCGIGTMLARMLEWDLLEHAAYAGIDSSVENITQARGSMTSWASEHGYSSGAYPPQEQLSAAQPQHIPEGKPKPFPLPPARQCSGPAEQGLVPMPPADAAAQSPGQPELHLSREGRQISVELEAVDLFDFIPRHAGQRSWDLIVAHAFLDLVDIPRSLPKIFRLAHPGTLLYFTLVFDGATILEPGLEQKFDELVERLYHRTMDERITGATPSGDSRSGRHLFMHLRQAGAQLLAAGGSDWVVFPGAGGYPGDEAYFLHFILHTVEVALSGHPGLDRERFHRWIAARHAQVERGELHYIAHQLDFLGIVGGET